ncbi:MAG TPA: sugar ABC transporter ATP-binding protein, partial [Rectinemataceae bacterium]|nr:sugar ABC transporter ATP-binding protein [Rectinemataceae bacterium]
MSPPLLELRSLRKTFSGSFALEDICLSLEGGQVNVLIGQNGSGKSALMKLVCGQYRRDSGAVLLGGQEVDFPSMHESRKAGIAYQQQDPLLYDNLSVAENVFFHRIPRRRMLPRIIDPLMLQKECAELFARLGVGIEPQALIAELGYTERLLVMAAQTCVADARLVILDEPTAGMADPEREILFNIVREIRGRGIGVVYISHKLDEIPILGDLVTVIHEGRISGSLPVGEADRETLIRLMTGRSCTERYPRLNVEPGARVLSVEHLQSGGVLKDVSFALKRGEILGITGLMGSGRTRLANCLFGQTRPSGGSITVDGRKAEFGHPAEALARGLALIPEDREQNAVFHFQDIVRNMSLASLLRFKGGSGLDTRYMHELTDEYIRSLGILPGHPDDLMRSYSGGNQQK